MKTPFYPLALSLLLSASIAPAITQAAEGNIPLPTSLAGQVTSNGGRVPDCTNKPRLTSYYQSLRQRAREGYAREIAKLIPSLQSGTKCINSKEAFGAQYMSAGDYFLISCLAETKGKLTHLFTMELISEIPACFSDTTIKNFVDSGLCQRPGEPERFERGVLLACPMQTSPMAKFRGASSVHPIDPDYYARLINARPSVQNIVDGRDFRVKIGRSGGSSSGSPTEEGCNAGGCLPGFGKTAR
jgi:hypothetical protein